MSDNLLETKMLGMSSIDIPKADQDPLRKSAIIIQGAQTRDAADLEIRITNIITDQTITKEVDIITEKTLHKRERRLPL